ncbi:MAG: hypothetical protein ACK481_00315 [Candidatus Melainabacteria bacterium]|jgi:hypothetical protein
MNINIAVAIKEIKGDKRKNTTLFINDRLLVKIKTTKTISKRKVKKKLKPIKGSNI